MQLTFKHESVHLLSNVFICQHISIIRCINQKIQKGKLPLQTNIILMFISGPTQTFLLSLLNHLVSEAVQGGKDTPELVPCWGEREEALVPQPRGPLPLEHNVAGLIDCPDILSVALLLGIDTLPHGGLADDVQGAVGHLC